jgi:hypothetical protein
MPAREYLVRFLEMPSSRLDEMIEFTFRRSDGSIRKCQVESVLDTDKRPKGLMYTEVLAADDVEAAIGAARADISFISSLIALTSGVAVSEPTMHIAFTNDIGRVHQFKQLDVMKDFPYSTGNAKPDIIERVSQKLQDIGAEDVKERLIVSIQMFRKAQSIEDDPLLRFILLWVSLELVDYALIRKLNPPISTRCPVCGSTKGSQLNRGLKEFVKETDPQKLDELDEITNIRNSILHRTRDFGLERNRANLKTAFLVDLFIRSLEFVLDTPMHDLIPSKFIPRVATCYEINQELMLSEPGLFATKGSADMPHVSILHHPGEVLMPGRDVKIQSKATFTEVGFPKNITNHIKRETRLLCIGCKPEDIRLV